MSAPSGRPLWVDPCGGTDSPTGPSNHEMDISSTTPDQELLKNIIITAKLALSEAKEFSETYVRNTFNQPLKKHHETWVHSRYEWLPSKEEIPKELEEHTPSKHFKLGELDMSLLKSYEYLQRIAVGLEQVHHDQKRYQAEFEKEFEKVMYRLRQVLCEVHNAISERNHHESIIDMERSIMDESFRLIDDRTQRNMRDWFIYRDFMNCLEYLIDLCEFFKAADAEGGGRQ